MSWYPGHMARAMRLLRQRMRLVDVVLEVADARAPAASRNPLLVELVEARPRLLVLARSDLADPASTGGWVAHLATRGEEAVAVDVRTGRGLEGVRAWLEGRRGKLAHRSWHRPLRLVVVGVSNVGKSSLLNRLTGQRVARTGALPGVTRGEQWVRVADGPGGGVEALDLPGLLPPRPEPEVATTLVAIGVLPWGQVPYPRVISCLLEALPQRGRLALRERYGVEWGAAEEALAAIARRRGFLGAGGAPDPERAARALLADFQAGRLGRITLERAPGPEGTGEVCRGGS
ncbi:MAG: ribosome biogenesis GTPase YlqF [Bacillota bacterium]|nr:ribosome biogenesis GTPase YlqF [Bacillota bacterium]